MKKRMISETILHVSKRTNFNKPYTWGEIEVFLKKKKIQLEPNDTLLCGYDGGYDNGDSGSDESYFIKIIRKELESDEKFNKRVKFVKEMKELSRKKRYETYLEYRKEFEPDNADEINDIS